MPKQYDVIIVGGGPVGVALGIELGLQNINTLILEKHSTPLLSPRAQSLTARSMEFFMRWGINQKLRNKQPFPKDFKMQGVWCSALNGQTYGCASSADQFIEALSPEKPIRIPLYLTEDTLRERLAEFDCVTLLKEHELTHISENQDGCTITAFDRQKKEEATFTANYVAACDGANSIVRKQCQIGFEELAPPRHILNLLFKAPSLLQDISVDQGFIYFILDSTYPGAIGVVDPTANIWYAQVFFNDINTALDEVNIAEVLKGLTGMTFDFELLNAHFWKMQIELAKHYSHKNRVFLVGDSAHAFAPTGGFGLNTGLGDAVNLAWKLASVIRKKAPQTLLSTYEEERRPIAERNLLVAEENAAGAANVRKEHDPKKDPAGFVRANQDLAKKHLGSAGLMMGYTYIGKSGQLADYIPIVEPGYFLPHKMIKNQPIYTLLSPTKWTLISARSPSPSEITALCDQFALTPDRIAVLPVPEHTYPTDLLIRPDWHIAVIFE